MNETCSIRHVRFLSKSVLSFYGNVPNECVLAFGGFVVFILNLFFGSFLLHGNGRYAD